MKRFFAILFAILFAMLAAIAPIVSAQDAAPAESQSQASSGPGPGKPLPPNSQVTPPPDLTGLRERATFVADQIREQSVELMRFLAILALIYAGYHAQFRGLEEFVSTLLRIVFAFALLSSFKEIVPYFFDARKELIGSLPLDTVDATAQVGTMIGTVGLGTVLMGPAGIGLAAAVFIAALGILIVYSAQILFEAILLAFAPLAIACLAFRHTNGIFTAWMKTFIAILLVPVGWTLAMVLWKSVFGWHGGATDNPAENGTDLAASLIYTAAAGAIFMGMPVLTVWLVNHASGAAAAAMPSPLQVLSTYLSGMAVRSAATRGGAPSSTVSMPSAGGSGSMLSSTNVGASALASNASTQTASNPYTDRIRTAQKHHKPSS